MAEPALAKVTIFEIAKRPWGWLSTSAEVDDRVYSLGFIRASVHGGATCNRSHIDGTETNRRRRPEAGGECRARGPSFEKKKKQKKTCEIFFLFCLSLCGLKCGYRKEKRK